MTQKLAIEVVGVENSALRQGKTWRVYGAAEILRRRREAGYLWTVRDRSTVRLVQMTTLETSLSADDQSPPAAAENPVPPVSALEKIRIHMDDDKATAKLCDRCRAVDAAASDEEILYFLEFSMASLRRRSMVAADWREQLIAEVPRRFAHRSLIERYRLEQRGLT